MLQKISSTDVTEKFNFDEYLKLLLKERLSGREWDILILLAKLFRKKGELFPKNAWLAIQIGKTC